MKEISKDRVVYVAKNLSRVLSDRRDVIIPFWLASQLVGLQQAVYELDNDGGSDASKDSAAPTPEKV